MMRKCEDMVLRGERDKGMRECEDVRCGNEGMRGCWDEGV